MGLLGAQLPDFPWDSLVPVRERAAAHPDGVVDLTIGTPVDSVPSGARAALDAASDAHGYPLTVGTAELRAAVRGWLERRRGVRAETGVLPTIGSKEMVALLPSLLGLGSADAVGFPRASYPTYDVGARLAGAKPLPVDTDADPSTWPAMSMLWLNSPGNPDGHVLGVERLRAILAWARERGVVVASDECYAELAWDVPEAPSILDERVCDGDVAGLLCLYSLSKQSNMAGYRAAFLAGDPAMIGPIAEIRKHAGFLMPGPVQAAMTWALGDDAHVAEQRAVYARRREKLLAVLDAAGLVNDPLSVAGLYIWAAAKRPGGAAGGTVDGDPVGSVAGDFGADAGGGVDTVVGDSGADAAGGVAGSNHDGGSVAEAPTGWDIVRACAELGIVVAPGDFYGEAGRDRVRISLTATDSAIDEAVRRLPRLPEALLRS